MEFQLKHFLILISTLILFSWRFSTIKQPNYPSGTRIKITATLKEEPKIVGNTQRLTLAGIKITTWRYPDYHYGERLAVTGRVKDNRLELPSIEKEIETDKDREDGREIRGKIYELRRKIEESYKRILSEPQASLLSGIVLGSKSGMPKDFYEASRKTGTLHIMVASGMNINIVAMTTMPLFLLFFRRQVALILSFTLIWFYVLLTGADAPAVRAGIMGSLIFLAQILGREADAWRGLVFAAGLLLFADPRSLLDLGFQLSFAATAGILFFSPWFSRKFRRLPEKVRPDFCQTISAQIATLPIILYNFGYYSPLSPLVNILIAPVIPWIMRLGLLGVLLWPILWLILPLLTYIVEVVEWFGR